MSQDDGQNKNIEGQAEIQNTQDPNALTEQDKKIYNQILSSINKMDKKIKNAKQKKPDEKQEINQQNEITETAVKLIEAKQKSDIVTNQNLLKDVNNSFQETIVEVYSQNKQLKKKIQSLIAIIKVQNKKISGHAEKQDILKLENDKIIAQIARMRESQMIISEPVTNKKNPNSPHKNGNRSPHQNIQAEDYDFWNSPQNQNASKKKGEFVGDSGLWVNDKDIDKSVFIAEQGKKRR